MSDLRISARGVRTVAVLELRQRVRSSRWVVVLVVWVLAVLGISALIWLTADSIGDAGALLFSGITFLVLSLGVLVAPALSATSINGDRASGVLAPLQVTLLSPADIAVGELLAAWTAALVLLLTASPVLLWAVVVGDAGAGRAVSALVLLAVTLGVVCAIGLGWSAVCARTATSAVLTYVSVALLCLGTPLFFLLSLPLVTAEEEVTVREPTSYSEDGTPLDCAERQQVQDVSHTERSWWLLAASPYVVVADAAPPRPPVAGQFESPDVLSLIRTGVRTAKAGPQDVVDYCEAFTPQAQAADRDRVDAAGAVWPWGLALDLALGGLGLGAAVRRLQVPIRALATGTRVA